MTCPPSGPLQQTLQAAVQSVQWTYSLFWQFCSQQGVLVWTDGYYNGAIKTRKTVQPMDVTAEEATLQRSQQLRELYESLLAGETNQPARRPCAALSPEDLTESEWFYLMCVSFSFPPGVGLPGKAYARRQHVWLTGANDADSKVFSRAILAKSARIQTVVCIPLINGVVELGNTERVQEDLGLVQHIKSFFADHHVQQLPHSKPALSEHSTSNPRSASRSRFSSPPLPSGLTSVHPLAGETEMNQEDDEDDEDDELDSDSEDETGRDHGLVDPYQDPIQPSVQLPHEVLLTSIQGMVEPSELMQLEMPEDIRIGSPEEYSNNLDTSNSGAAPVGPQNQHVDESYRAESSRAWPLLQEELSSSLPPTGAAQINEVAQEDNHYSQTLSALLQRNANRMATSSSSATGNYLGHSIQQSAFTRWSCRSGHLRLPVEGTSQWMLKYILFSVPFLHSKCKDDSSPKSQDGNRFKKGTPQEELSANHVLAERRRREKLNERFIILRSLVPFVTKMDKASILGDTIEYVKQLRRKIQDLELRNRQMESEQRVKKVADASKPNSSNEGSKGNAGASNVTSDRITVPNPDGRKKRIVEGSKGMEALPLDNMVQVSIIESDALLELECPYRDGLLLHILQTLCDLRLEVTAVQSSSTNGVFVAELRAKVKYRANGKKASIVEVKKAIHQIIL